MMNPPVHGLVSGSVKTLQRGWQIVADEIPFIHGTEWNVGAYKDGKRIVPAGPNLLPESEVDSEIERLVRLID